MHEILKVTLHCSCYAASLNRNFQPAEEEQKKVEAGKEEKNENETDEQMEEKMKGKREKKMKVEFM